MDQEEDCQDISQLFSAVPDDCMFLSTPYPAVSSGNLRYIMLSIPAMLFSHDFPLTLPSQTCTVWMLYILHVGQAKALRINNWDI